MSINITLVLLLALFGSCRSRVLSITPPKLSESTLKDDRTPISDIKLQTKIVHTDAGGNFLMTMNLSKSVDLLIFRTFEDSPYETIKTWFIESSEFSIVKNDGTIVVRRIDGLKFEEVTFRIKAEIDIKQNNNQFYIMSDGSVALTLTQFSPYIYEVNALTGSRTLERMEQTFEITPRTGQLASSGALVGKTSLNFTRDLRATDTLVYFGRKKPKKLTDFILAADPAIPLSLVEIVESTMSLTLEKLAKELGPLPFKPFVLATFPHDPTTNDGAGGEAFWGSYVVHLSGDGLDITDEERFVIQNAVSHETSHFWAAIIYQMIWASDDESKLFPEVAESNYDAWIWEGGAQALALDVLRDTKQLTAKRYNEIRAIKFNDCKSVLGSKRIIDTPSHPEELTWAPYHCGQWIQSLIVDLRKKTNPRYNIYKFWKAIFNASGEAKEIDNQIFFNAVRSELPTLSDSEILNLKKIFITPGNELDALMSRAALTN